MSRPRARILASTTALCATASLCLGLPSATAETGDPNDPVVTAPGTATPRSVTGVDETIDDDVPERAARSYLARNKATFAIEDPAGSLESLDVSASMGTETVRFQQKYKGVRVLGAHYLVHQRDVGARTQVLGANGHFYTELNVDVHPTITTDQAGEQARNLVAEQLSGGKMTLRQAPEMAVEPEGLVVIPEGRGSLAHQVRVSTTDPETHAPVVRTVYVDAHTSWALFAVDAIQTASPVDGTGVSLGGSDVPLNLTRTDDGRYEFRDQSRVGGAQVRTYDGRTFDVIRVLGTMPKDIKLFSGPTSRFAGEATEAGLVDAHANASHVYDYYEGLGRAGLDGEGGDVDTVVGVTANGRKFVNAFWDGAKMVYGGGDDEYQPMSAELDVVGHEMTHGVIQHTANLLYRYQSGAINEALADYFGNAIDVDVAGMSMDHPDAALLGENLCRTTSPRDCALRDLNDGRTTDDFIGLTLDYDNGGVHENSTIFSGALWDIRESLGGTVADPLVYKALSEYMTPTDDFVDGRNALIQAAKDTHVGSHGMGAIVAAFNKHGIVQGWDAKAGDATPLMREIMAERTGPAAGGGWWIQSQTAPEGNQPYAIYSGRTDGKGETIKLSDPLPDQGSATKPARYNVLPATDGKWAVWFAWGSDDARIMRAPIDGSGEPEEVGGAVNPSNLSVDGDWIAWTSTIRGTPKQWYLNASQPFTMQPVDSTYHKGSASGAVKDGKLYYLLRWPDASGYHLNVAVRDLATAKETLIPEFLPQDGHAGAGLYPPRPVDGRLVLGVDQYPGSTSAVWKMGLDGADRTAILPEDHADAPIMGSYDATNDAVTFENWPGTTPPRIMQIGIDGGPAQRMSCSDGVQYRVTADEGTRALWLDGSYGSTSLVVQDRPRQHC